MIPSRSLRVRSGGSRRGLKPVGQVPVPVVSQSLFSMTLHARTAERALTQTGRQTYEAAASELSRVGELSRPALAEMRALIFELRPAALAEEGLVAGLTKQPER